MERLKLMIVSCHGGLPLEPSLELRFPGADSTPFSHPVWMGGFVGESRSRVFNAAKSPQNRREEEKHLSSCHLRENAQVLGDGTALS